MNAWKTVSLISLLSVCVLLILPYLIGGFEWDVVVLVVLYTVGGVSLAIYFFSQGKQPTSKSRLGDITDKELRTVTVVACYKCDFKKEREFEKGDYIGKTLEKCAECSGKTYVKSIYAIEEKRK